LISGNEKIDNFIQEINNKTIFEWIPYNQFNEIKKIGNNNSAIIYSAIWKDGPLYFNEKAHYEWYFDLLKRDSNKEVALRCLQNSQNSIEFLINKV
jgi:hypothetical protein